MFLITGARINPINETIEAKITYGTWLEIWLRCLQPAPVDAKRLMLATGEQLTPVIEPDNIAAIDSTKIKEFIEEVTLAIIGIKIPKVAHDEPIANDSSAEIIKEAAGINDSEILQEKMIFLI